MYLEFFFTKMHGQDDNQEADDKCYKERNTGPGVTAGRLAVPG